MEMDLLQGAGPKPVAENQAKCDRDFSYQLTERWSFDNFITISQSSLVQWVPDAKKSFQVLLFKIQEVYKC